MLRAADQLTWDIVELLKKANLTPAQYNVLRILRGAHPDGLACRDVGERLINRDPDVTRLLDRMEHGGLIKRTREAKDRRVITVRITDEGLQILKQFDQPVDVLHRIQFDSLSQSELKTLVDLLQKICDDPK